MSANPADYSSYYPEYGDVALPQLMYAPRKLMQLVWFVPGVAISGISYLADGIPALTDLSFVLLTAACLIQIVEELVNFSRRFGMGGITLFAGVLVWFCHDYFTNWFGLNFATSAETVLPTGAIVTPYVLAKATFLHQLFVCMAVAGLHLPVWQRLDRHLVNMPEPQSDNFYVPLIIAAFIVGMIPYAFFTSYPLPIALWKEITVGRTEGVFTVGRTGNVNVNWGAYLAQLQQIGQVGAMLALFYVMLLRPGVLMRAFGLFYWLLYVALAFGSGTRGQTAFMALPALFVMFLKHQGEAAAMFRRLSVKAYVVSGVLGLILLVMLQVQITYRNVGFTAMRMEEVKTGIEGNSMFSEGLSGMNIIPEQAPFLANRFPGQGAVLCLPDVAWRFLYGPIPRALWKDKPIDPLWKWYNSVITGRSEEEMEGTTVSTGLVGDFYFRFGIAGVVEGGLLFGFMCLISERLLQNSQGRILQLVTATGLLTFMFRSFRNLTFINLYPLLIGVAFLLIIIKFRGSRQEQPQYYA